MALEAKVLEAEDPVMEEEEEDTALEVAVMVLEAEDQAPKVVEEALVLAVP